MASSIETDATMTASDSAIVETAASSVDADNSRSSATLEIFTDGCFEPVSGQGGWAFVVYREGTEIDACCGGAGNTANNEMEAMALLKALQWISGHAAEETAVLLSDSVYAVDGSNRWRHIWRHNGWKKIDANPRARRRVIASPDIWKAIDAELNRNPSVTISWCKGHAGINGNERADEMANRGRLSIGSS